MKKDLLPHNDGFHADLLKIGDARHLTVQELKDKLISSIKVWDFTDMRDIRIDQIDEITSKNKMLFFAWNSCLKGLGFKSYNYS
jgi:hypothetical protein|tara:strand:- start:338 stop:589 length:252 start_codon:yes stop_codon:yes gene_type:complete